MNPPLPIDGVLPPDLQGTLVRVGPGEPRRRRPPGRAARGSSSATGPASRILTAPSSADANVFWHAGKVLALAESGLPQQFSRALEPEEFDGGLHGPHRLARPPGRRHRGPGPLRGGARHRDGRPVPAHRRVGRRPAHSSGAWRSSWSGPRGSTTSASRPATSSSSSRPPSSPRPSRRDRRRPRRGAGASPGRPVPLGTGLALLGGSGRPGRRRLGRALAPGRSVPGHPCAPRP